ncbi:MAG: hypothetical protein ABFD79_03525 [Phycisphaerales bacterium]
MKMDAEEKPKKNIKANIFAITSLVIVVLWLVIVIMLWTNQRSGIGLFVRYSGRICVIAALLFGIISIKSNKTLKGAFWCKPMAIGSCILAVYLYIAVQFVLPDNYDVRNYICESNLKTLSTAIKVYCQKHNGEFPDPAKWCDLLLSVTPQKSDDEYDLYWKLSEKNFKCEAMPGERNVYAFNQNLVGKRISEVDSNVVVIFESKIIGWNQKGDAGILCSDLHKQYWGESGVYVLFPKQYDVRFVPQSEVKNLRWEP